MFQRNEQMAYPSNTHPEISFGKSWVAEFKTFFSSHRLELWEFCATKESKEKMHLMHIREPKTFTK